MRDQSGRDTGIMTIGALSRRTGVAVKTLRAYEDAGLIQTAGRSPGNYRLLTSEAVACVKVIETFRSLGLTLAELQEFAAGYLARPDEPAGGPWRDPHAAAQAGSAVASAAYGLQPQRKIRPGHLDRAAIV